MSRDPRQAEILQQLGLTSWVLRTARRAAPPEVSTVASPLPAAVASASPPATVVTVKASSAVPPAATAPSMSPALPLPTDWVGLRAAVARCQACRLCQTRTQTVFGVGPERAPLMIVGEGPGADEDASGEPFVGRAGKLLDEMLKAIGHSRAENVYIANVVKCRPPGNRDPAADEAEACRPFLEAQIAQVQPRLIVALGRIAAQRLLVTDEPLARLRGPLHHYGAGKTPLFVTYHPAYLLRSPREKAKSWQDLKLIHRHLHAAA
jgi:uracil-DNA glycosylase